jgi:hypothetical protein
MAVFNVLTQITSVQIKYMAYVKALHNMTYQDATLVGKTLI